MRWKIGRQVRAWCWLWLGLALAGSHALAQETAPDAVAIYAQADRAMMAGDPDSAQRDIIGIMSQQTAPSIIGAGALRLSQIAQLASNLPAAEQPLQDALKLLPPADGTAQPVLAAIYLQLGALAMARGDMGRAQLALLKGLAIGKRVATPDDPQLLEAELSLAIAEIRAIRWDAAAARLAQLEPRAASSTPRVVALYQAAVGELNFRQYRYLPALAAQRKARDLFRTLYGPNHAELARAETSLGSSLFSAGQYQDAERSLQDAVAIYDRHPDFYAPALATTLVNLGQLFYTTGRSALAMTALTRAVELARRSVGPGSQLEAAARLHRGFAGLRQNDLVAAADDLAAAIAIWSAPATQNQRAAAGTGVWLAEVKRRAGDFPAAKIALDQSGTVLAKIFGADSYAMTDVLVGQAELAMAHAAPADAVAILKRALTIRAHWVGNDHVATLEVRSQLAQALATSGDVAAGRSMAVAVTDVLRRRIALLQAAQSGSMIEEVAALRRLLGRHVQVIALALQGDPPAAEKAALLAESFAVAQLARASAAGTAIAGLGQRQAQANPATVAALRDVQESVLRWQMAERSLAARVAAADAGDNLAAAQAEIEHLGQSAGALQADLMAAHPDLAGLGVLPSVTPSMIQASLLPGEALLAYLTLEDQSYLWTISQDRVAMIPIDHNDAWLADRIRALRATVDPREVQSVSDIRPFDVAAAADLYDTLVAPAALPSAIAHLVIVPDGTLQSLPFATLLSRHVAEPSDFAEYRQLPWLITARDLTFLPEIGAFAALRKLVKPSAAKLPFLGLGDPVLGGAAAPADANTPIADLLRGLPSLPESADELAGLAVALKADPASVVTGAAATEMALKALPLQDYRVIAFATHGLMAGDFGRLREPGLVLTPPAEGNGEDDGLLTVGEIAQLKLDADWVVLSACNTAAADGSPGAEGLSGLARAFFFAGSRALLVSQWEVLSVAAVQLTTGAFEHLAANPSIGRAATLRLSMLALLAEDQPDYLAHPIFWAPFELVGEGGAQP